MELRLLLVEHFAGPPRLVRSQRHLPHFHLNVILEGTYCAEIAGESIMAGPGEVVLLPLKRHWREWNPADEPTELWFVDFEWDDPPATLASVCRDRHGLILLLTKRLLACGKPRETAPSDYEQALLQAIVAEYLEESQAPDSTLLLRLQAHARTHLAAPVTLADLARLEGMHATAYSRKFRAETGSSPMREWRRLRLEAARRLALSTWLPLKTIAARVGLCNAPYLAKLYREHFGLSIAQQRQQAGRVQRVDD